MKQGRWIQVYYNRQGKRYRDIRASKKLESVQVESGKWEEMSEKVQRGDAFEGALKIHASRFRLNRNA